MRASNIINDRIIELRERIPERQSSAWSEKEKCTLMEMFNEGTGITAMALYFCRSEPAIINMLDDMKMYVKKQRHRVASMSSACKCPECELFTTGRVLPQILCKVQKAMKIDKNIWLRSPGQNRSPCQQYKLKNPCCQGRRESRP